MPSYSFSIFKSITILSSSTEAIKGAKSDIDADIDTEDDDDDDDADDTGSVITGAEFDDIEDEAKSVRVIVTITIEPKKKRKQINNMYEPSVIDRYNINIVMYIIFFYDKITKQSFPLRVDAWVVLAIYE